MKQEIELRLQSLKDEFTAGQKILADLEAKQASVRDTLIRINGAVQILEELLAEATTEPDLDSSNGKVPEPDYVFPEASPTHAL